MPHNKLIKLLNCLILSAISIVMSKPASAEISKSCSNMTATQISKNISIGKLSSTTCVNELLNLIKKYDSRNYGNGYNAFIAYNKENILNQAKQIDPSNFPKMPLLGVPVLIKDNIDVKGYNTTAGTFAFKNNLAKTDATVVHKLKDAGAIILGKTNMHELAAGVTSNNFIYGPVRNPYDKNMFSGGSSGGTAAAIALGYAPIGLGTDTAGSTRIPSALCGIVGFRPSTSRYSTQGVVPAAPTFDTVGLMARDVPDIILLDQVLTSEKIKSIKSIKLKGLRLGVPRELFYDNLDPEVKRLTNQALAKLKASGVILVEKNIHDIKKLVEAESFNIAMYEFIHELNQYLKDRHLKLNVSEVIEQIKSPDVKFGFMALQEKSIQEQEYKHALLIGRPALQSAYDIYFKEHHIDAIIFPTTPLPARSIITSLKTVELNDKLVPTVDIYTRNTTPAANAGLPAITLPIGLTKNGLPVGIELDGRPQKDIDLLQIALSIEQLFEKLQKPKGLLR